MKKLKIGVFKEKEFQNPLQIKGGATTWKNVGDANWRGGDTTGPLPGGGTYFNFWEGTNGQVTNGTDHLVAGGGYEVPGVDYIELP